MGKTGRRCVRIGKVRSWGYEELAVKEKRKPKGKLRDRLTIDDGGFKDKKETVRKTNKRGNSDDWKNFSRELPDRSTKVTKTKKRIANEETGSCKSSRC